MKPKDLIAEADNYRVSSPTDYLLACVVLELRRQNEIIERWNEHLTIAEIVDISDSDDEPSDDKN